MDFTLSTIVFYIALFCCKCVIGLNKNASFEDLVRSMELIQHRMCPEVPLCRKSDSSVLEKNPDDLELCCSECSCHESCVEDKTCCPDFHLLNLTDAENYFQDSNVSSYREIADAKQFLNTYDEIDSSYNLTEHDLVAPNSFADGVKTKKCVKVRYGKIKLKDGYKMIASCPVNYTNLTISHLCDASFNLSIPKTIVDHIPVYDYKIGIAYKNYNCYLCNTASAGHFVFWKINIECISLTEFSMDIRLHSHMNVIEKILNHPKCSIMYRPPYQSQYSVHGSLEKCTFQNDESSCKSKYTGTNLEQICNTQSYIWPIKHDQVYINLACLLCNDEIIYESCEEKYNTFKGVLNLKASEDQVYHIEKVVENEFIDLTSKGDASTEVVCPKGFFFHKMKNICRQIFCPKGFYVLNGSCVPLFSEFSGVKFESVVKIQITSSLNGENGTHFENAIIYAVNKALRQLDGKYSLSFCLNTNKEEPGIVRTTDRYYIVFYLTNHTDFYAYCKFLYDVVTKRGLIRLPLMKNRQKRLSIQMAFQEGFVAMGYNGRREIFYTREDDTCLRGLSERTLTEVRVSKLSLCYRMALNFSELRIRSQIVQSVENKKVIGKFHELCDNQLEICYVCLDDIQSWPINYIFDKSNCHRNKNHDKHFKEITFDDKGNDLASVSMIRSFIAFGCSVGILVFIYFFKRIMKCANRFATIMDKMSTVEI